MLQTFFKINCKIILKLVSNTLNRTFCLALNRHDIVLVTAGSLDPGSHAGPKAPMQDPRLPGTRAKDPWLIHRDQGGTQPRAPWEGPGAQQFWGYRAQGP